MLLLFSSAAHNGCDDWVRYWIHTGHLHIDGLKMSKSLKNFVSIKDYLSSQWTSFPADDLRIYFLHHKYHSTLHFSKDRIVEAASYRKRMLMFFEMVNKTNSLDKERISVRWAPESVELQRLRQKLVSCKLAVDVALRDDFDTPEVMRLLAELVSAADPLVRDAVADVTIPVQTIYATHKYVSKMLRIFGLAFAEVCLLAIFVVV